MSFTATYDACVPHPAGLRDLLVRLAGTGLFHAKWSNDILNEMAASVLRRRPGLDPTELERTRKLMCGAVPDCLTTGYTSLIGALELPDPDDRHVLAAAIRSGSQVIVTENTRDFPASILETYDMEAQTPDVFVLHLIDISPTTVARVVIELWGERYPVSTYKYGFTKCIDLLYERHRDDFDRVLELKGSKHFYVARNPQDVKYGADGYCYEPMSSGYFFDTWLSANDSKRRAGQLLELFGHDASDFKVLFD